MTDWTTGIEAARRSLAKEKLIRDSLTVEDRKAYDRYSEELRLEMAAFDGPNREESDPQAVRREWAAKIREEFGKYHEHLADGGECAACGAIQAANFMDPDYTRDGPKEERG